MNQFLGWSLSLGRLFGIPIRVHWTLVALTAFWVLTESTPMAMGWRLAVCGVLWFTILIHELGHAFAARGVGGEANSIMLWPLGGLAFTTHPGGLVEDTKVVLGGPLTHIPLGLLFAKLLTLQGVAWDWSFLNPMAGWPILTGGFWSFLFFYGLKIQVVLLILNLCVPVYPLDGGRILANLLRFRFTRETTVKVIIPLSVVSGVAFIFLGYLFIGFLVFYETYVLFEARKSGQLGQHPIFRADSRADSARASKRPKPSGPAKVLPFTGGLKAPKTKPCPFCHNDLPSSAKMCGRCEKMLPN